MPYLRFVSIYGSHLDVTGHPALLASRGKKAIGQKGHRAVTCDSALQYAQAEFK